MDSEFKLPLEMFYFFETTQPEKVYFKQPIDGVFKEYTWGEVGNQARKMANHLKSLNLPDKSNIGLISKNCVHWIMADLAIWMAGHVSVPLYPTLTDTSVNQILEHSEAKLLFVGKLDDWPSMRPGVPKGLNCISFPYNATDEFTGWDEIIKSTEPLDSNTKTSPKDLSTIIYTSGTTGMPKGVMHNFGGMAFAATNYKNLVNMGNDEKFFSYLPLSHVAERILIELGSLYSGGTVSFAESLDTFAQNLAQTSPTVFLGVPRIWMKFQEAIQSKMPEKKFNLLLSIPIISWIIKRKIKKALGLDKTRYNLTGAAPMPLAVQLWYKKLGISFLEAYSMTENLAYSHATYPNRGRMGFIGEALPGVEVKYSDAGELLVKSKATMIGYFKEPEKTAEAMDGDYLRTGDIGEENDGYLKITGRVKDMFKTSKGKYVTPSPIELKFASDANIEQVCLVGVGLPQPILLAVLSEVGVALSKDDITASLTTLLNTINEATDKHERPHRLVVVKGPWGVENNLLTPTLKIKRNEVEKAYQDNFENWYKESDKIVWQS